jgi:putative intracellular protease/amidase
MEPATMDIAIPLYDRFTALDAVGPYEVLWRIPGARVHWIGAEAHAYSTDRGLQLVAEATLDDVPAPDVLVVPGGTGTLAALEDERLLDWIRRADATSTWTTSVCTGSLLLGAAGLLDGLEATSHWLDIDDLERYGAHPIGKRVVEQGKVITAAGVSSGIDMALLLASRIAGDEFAQGIQLLIEYDPQPPFDAGSPDKAPPETVELISTMARQHLEQLAASEGSPASRLS